MLTLGLFVAAWLPERHFTPSREHRWPTSLTIFRRSVTLARRDREILLVFAATLPRERRRRGIRPALFQAPRRAWPISAPDPIVWLTALGIVTLAVGALALRVVEAHIDGLRAAPRAYAAACFIGALGLIVLADAPDEVTDVAGVLLVAGIAEPVTHTVSVIWVNRRATSDVRATVESFLAQADTSARSLRLRARRPRPGRRYRHHPRRGRGAHRLHRHHGHRRTLTGRPRPRQRAPVARTAASGFAAPVSARLSRAIRTASHPYRESLLRRDKLRGSDPSRACPRARHAVQRRPLPHQPSLARAAAPPASLMLT